MNAHSAASGSAPSDSAQAKPVAAIVEIHVRDGHQEDFLQLLHPVLDAMRNEPTFINAVLHRDPQDPTQFMIYETWSDLNDLVEVQVKRDYRKAYLDCLPTILRAERQITLWEPLRADFSGR